MRISVNLFATLKDKAGTDCIEVEVPDNVSIKELIETIGRDYPELRENAGAALVAVNHEFAFPEDVLQASDEVALFPPVSGGADWPEYFAITEEHLDVSEIIAHITRPETGAVCVFSGAVRGVTKAKDGPIDTSFLMYEAYEPMATAKLRQVADEIREKYPTVQGIAAVQRIGKLDVGETTVLIACASGHRNDGIFEATKYGIDRLKEIVPVWKKEVGPDGSEWVEGSYHPTPDDISQPTEE